MTSAGPAGPRRLAPPRRSSSSRPQGRCLPWTTRAILSRTGKAIASTDQWPERSIARLLLAGACLLIVGAVWRC